MYSSSTVVLLLSVYTGNYRIVFAVPVYYCSSKKVYSIVYILLQLHSKYNTILRLIDGTWYITEWNSESRYGIWYNFSNPWSTVAFQGLWTLKDWTLDRPVYFESTCRGLIFWDRGWDVHEERTTGISKGSSFSDPIILVVNCTTSVPFHLSNLTF